MSDTTAPKRAPVIRQRRRPDPEAAADAYDVGYRKPPVAHRFKTGTSGNPRGRPKGSRGMDTRVRELLERPVVVRTDGRPKKVQLLDALLEKAAEQAIKGDRRALLQLISLYRTAVPDVMPVVAADDHVPGLDSDDEAILAAFTSNVLRRASKEDE